MREVEIAGRKIGVGCRPFVVAEMSGNHGGSLERAMSIVEAAAAAGADAVKLQTYTADTMTLDLEDGDFAIDDPASPWNGYTLYQLYDEAHTPWEWHESLFHRCRELDLIGFSTPFDSSAVEFLEGLSVPAYKVASFEIGDLALLHRIAVTGKPLVLSTGMATAAEIEEALHTIDEGGGGPVILLKCTSAYPAPPEAANLLTIPALRERFDAQVGISDHTRGIGVALAAVALGATLVEKHFTLDRSAGGIDAAFSLEPDELRALVVESERAWRSLGQVGYGPGDQELGSLRFRRSLYVVADLRAGDELTSENVRAIRPGFGLPPGELAAVLGRRVVRDVARGTPLSWELIT